MSRVSITVDVPEEWAHTANEIANTLGITQTDVFREAFGLYMAEYEQQEIESEEALIELRNGSTLSHEEALKRFAEHTRSAQAA